LIIQLRYTQNVLEGFFLTGTRIFFVEDDEIVANVIEWRLNKLGYSVCGSANNGVDAITLIKGKKPDLVFLDIELKGPIDGIEMGKLLSSQTNIPFVYLTAHTEDSILKRAKNTGSRGYVKKPFSDDDLRVAIELAL